MDSIRFSVSFLSNLIILFGKQQIFTRIVKFSTNKKIATESGKPVTRIWNFDTCITHIEVFITVKKMQIDLRNVENH